MENLKYPLSLLICILLCTCEFDPLKFVYSPYDVNQRFSDSQTYNEQTPRPSLQVPEESYCIGFASDPHLRTEPGYLPAFWDWAERQNAALLLMGGDFYNGKEEYANYVGELLKSYTRLPLYPTAGNHDCYHAWSDYYRNIGSATYTFTVKTPTKEDLYIALESASATLGESQWNWLQQQLSQRHHYRHCFVFTHNNFVVESPTNGVYNQEELQALLQLFSEYHVSAVLTGHSHIKRNICLLHVPYWTTGALKNGECTLIHVNEKEVSVDFIQL